mmetsp:Transcript_101395/g.286025  ORF Transcript_101395/g.286025 Transcript_101395/m.286025 type:complete len:289 (-) Transcript_101395:521-1387(-)
MVLRLEASDTTPVRPLGVSVDVHLDHTIVDGLPDVFEIRARAAVKDELHRLVLGTETDLFRNVFLRLSEDFWLELHVARLIHTMHVAKSRCDRELAVFHLGQRLVYLIYLIRLGVKVLRVYVLVVHAVLLPARDPELHLEHHTNLRHAPEVLLTKLDVFFERLLGQVEHVGREKRLAVLVKIPFVRIHQAVEPGEEVLGAVVCVEDHGDAILLCEGADVVRARDGARDCSMEIGVVQTFPSIELRASRGELDDNRSVVLFGGLEARVDTRGRYTVHGWDGKFVLLRPI